MGQRRTDRPRTKNLRDLVMNSGARRGWRDPDLANAKADAIEEQYHRSGTGHQDS